MVVYKSLTNTRTNTMQWEPHGRHSTFYTGDTSTRVTLTSHHEGIHTTFNCQEVMFHFSIMWPLYCSTVKTTLKFRYMYTTYS